MDDSENEEIISKKKILYAEDDESISRMNKRILGSNYEVMHSSNLEDALLNLGKSDFDLVLSDGTFPYKSKELPSKNSWELLYNAVRKKGDIPFVLYSSNMDAINKVEALMHSDKKLWFLTKPLDDAFKLNEYLESYLNK